MCYVLRYDILICQLFQSKGVENDWDEKTKILNSALLVDDYLEGVVNNLQQW